MPQELYYQIFNTDAGWLGILGSEAGLLRITLPQRSSREVHLLIGDSVRAGAARPYCFESLLERLTAYYSGYKTDFPDSLDLSGATVFQRKVWGVTRLIPYGETRSYAWVAGQINQPGAARAVGQALGKNPLPVVVPCHRVLAGSGELGGFTGGLDVKRFLLRLEKPGTG